MKKMVEQPAKRIIQVICDEDNKPISIVARSSSEDTTLRKKLVDLSTIFVDVVVNNGADNHLVLTCEVGPGMNIKNIITSLLKDKTWRGVEVIDKEGNNNDELALEILS